MFDTNVRPSSSIYKAVVIGVHPSRGTCDLRTVDTETRYLENVPWSSPFADLDGNGIDFCPVEDQYCYVLESTSNKQDQKSISSVIIGWCYPEINGAYGDGRERLSRNDIKLSNRKGAKVLLDANRGDLLVQSGPSCGFSMYRMSNMIHAVADSYQLDTRGGSVSWDTLGEDDENDRVRYSATVKSSAGDEVGFLRVLASSDGSGDFFQVQVTGPEAISGQFEAGDTSDLLGSPSQFAYIRFGSDGDGYVHTTNTLNLSSNDKVRITTKNEVEVDARAVSGHCHGPETDRFANYFVTPEDAKVAVDFAAVDATEVVINNRATGEVLFRTADDTIHNDSQNKRLFNEDLAEWLFNHTHVTPSGQTLPPLGRPSDVEFVPSQFNNQPLIEQIRENEINAANQLRLISALSTSVALIMNAISALDGGVSGNLILEALKLQGILGPAATIDDFTGPQGLLLASAEDLSDQADKIDDGSVVDNGELIEENYGITLVTDVMTKDTKVR